MRLSSSLKDTTQLSSIYWTFLSSNSVSSFLSLFSLIKSSRSTTGSSLLLSGARCIHKDVSDSYTPTLAFLTIILTPAWLQTNWQWCHPLLWKWLKELQSDWSNFRFCLQDQTNPVLYYSMNWSWIYHYCLVNILRIKFVWKRIRGYWCWQALLKKNLLWVYSEALLLTWALHLTREAPCLVSSIFTSCKS